jgi:small conductance mechanosensitive channel
MSDTRFLEVLFCTFLVAWSVGARAADDAPSGAEPAAVGKAASEEPEAPPVPELVVEATEIRSRIAGIDVEIDELEAQLRKSKGEDRLVIERQLAKTKLEYLELMGDLVANLLEREKEGLDSAELRAEVEGTLTPLSTAIVQHIDASERKLAELRAQRDELPAEELLDHQQRIAKESEWMLQLYRAYLDNVRHMESLGVDAGRPRADIVRRLERRAEQLAGYVELGVEQLAAIQKRAADKPDDAAVQAELAAVEQRQKNATQTLGAVVKMMDALELDAAEYQQLLITSTGEVTTDIFRAKVAIGLVDQSMQRVREWLLENGPGFVFKLLMFALILAVFRVLSGFTRRIIERGFASSKVQASQLLRSMAVSLAGNAVMILGLLIGLSQLGLELGPLLAGLGIAGFIVGFALQDSLSNFAAGLMILGYRPYDVGDLIETGGVFGRVSAMSLVSTTILTVDNQTLIVPNGKIWGDVIKNVTNQRVRRVDMTFGISYADDIEHAEKVLESILRDHPDVLDDPEPIVRLHTLNESSVDFVVRPWVKTEDYWDVYWHVTREVKRRFDAEGISIPFPQRDVHFHQTDGAGAKQA